MNKKLIQDLIGEVISYPDTTELRRKEYEFNSAVSRLSRGGAELFHKTGSAEEKKQ